MGGCLMVVVINGSTGISAPQINAGNIVGQVCFFAMNAAPAGFLACDGAAVSRSTYVDLFTATGTLYGAGDGSTTFNLPDLRGEFVRGLDAGRGVDSGRGIGTAQAQAMQAHTHSLGYVSGLASGGGLGAFQAGTGTNTTSTCDPETRPRNVALLACIKF